MQIINRELYEIGSRNPKANGVLDKRMISRRYGKLFVNSLPDVTLQQIGMDELSDQIKEWLK